MAMDNTWLSYKQLAEEVRRLCAEKRSGTLFCSLESHSSATIAMQNGQIVALGFNQGFKMTHGIAALALIQAIQKCKISFKQNVVLKVDQGLPDTPSLLQRIARRSHADAPTTEILKQSGSGEILKQSGSGITLFPPEFLAKLHPLIQEEARNAFGPIAELLCEEHFANVGQLRNFKDLERLLTAIATATGEIGRAEAFHKSVLNRLRSRRATA